MATVAGKRRDLVRDQLKKLDAGDSLVSGAERQDMQSAAQQATGALAASQTAALNRLADTATSGANATALQQSAQSAQKTAQEALLRANKQAADQAAQLEEQRRNQTMQEAAQVEAANQQKAQTIMQGVSLGAETLGNLAKFFI